MNLFKFLLLVAIAVLGAAFSSINPGEISLNYYFGTWSLSLGELVFVLLGLGILLGAMGTLNVVLRLKRENLDLRRKASIVNQEVKNLRIMPLKDR